MNPQSRKRLFLIDGYAMVYRAHFAMIRNPLFTSDGRHTSALFGFVNSMFKLLREEDPEYLAIVFDSKEKTFRHRMYPEYKATREKMPDELREQLVDLWKLTEAMNIPSLQVDGYEADDVIGTLAVQAKKAGMDVYIVSGDKDFMQLVDDSIQVLIPVKQNTPRTIFGREEVVQKWGVKPEQIIDFLGLMGDSSDNVPGVEGVGPKTAVELLKKYGDMETVIQHAEEIKNKRVREGLINGVDKAKLSKELVTIKTDVELSLSVKELQRKLFDFKGMEEIFARLEFFRLQDQLDSFKKGKPEGEIKNRVDKNYECVDTIEKLQRMIDELKTADLISFDIESTSINPMVADIVGFSFSIEDNRGWYVPVVFPEKKGELFTKSGNDLDELLNYFKPLLEDESRFKCGQNIKYDMLILKNHGIEVQGVIFDTMIAAHLLRPEARLYKLDYLSQEYLDYRMEPISDLIGTGKSQISMASVPLKRVTDYSAEDADVVFQLTPILKKDLEETELLKFFNQIEVPLIPVLVQMEQNGVFVDPELMSEMSLWMETKLDSFSREIYRLSGSEFNLNSPQQMAVVLFDKLMLPTNRKRSTAVNVLESLRNQHPLPGKVLEYRKFQKLKSTYVDAIPRLIHQKTGRIHSSFGQTITSTGRLSSSNPNFQNIPIRAEEGREIRKAFKPQKEGWKLLSADYSQIELRIMAHLSGDETLRKAFEAGEDIHAHTASNIYGVPIDAVLPEMRMAVKVVNFGVMYGAGPFRISQELGISLEEGRKIIEAYFSRYPGIRDYVKYTLERARKDKFVQTMLGRKRYCFDIDGSNQRIRGAAERATINMPIQGTAAEMIKLAMIAIQRHLWEKNFKAKMILQIHDELLFEVPGDEIEKIRELVVSKMENALKLDIPVVVDYGVGDSWYEAH